jgi:thioredoxin 1
VDPVSQEDFAAQVLQTPGKVVVDFWAEWCGPCRMIAPILEDLEREHPEIRFVKVNVDDDPAIAQQFEVLSIPTVLTIEDGQVNRRIVGALPKTKLLEELSDWLA